MLVLLYIVLALIGIMALVAIPYLFAYTVFNAAKHKVFATFVQNGTVEVVGAGSDEEGNVADYICSLANVTGYEIVKSCKMRVRFAVETASEVPPDPSNPASVGYEMKLDESLVELTDALIPKDAEQKKYEDGKPIFEDIVRYPEEGRSKWEKFLLGLFGKLGLVKKGEEGSFRWVSVWYFWKKVGTFRIIKARVKELKLTRDAPLRETIETERDTVDNLVWKSQRPILVQDVDLNDRSRCDIRATVMLVFIVPRIPVFVLKHRFYPILESAIEAAIIDFCRKRSYAQLVSHLETGPSSDFFPRALSRLNALGGGGQEDTEAARDLGYRGG